MLISVELELVFLGRVGCRCFILEVFVLQESELISLKREAKLKGGFYVEPEPKLMFVIRIRG